MARTVTSTATDKIDHGAVNNLDDIANFTVLVWIKPTLIDGLTFKGTYSKSVNTFCTHDNSAGFGGSGSMRVRIVHATTNLDYRSNTNVVVQDAWNFLAFVVDTAASAGNKVKLYRGSLTALASEVTYSLQQDQSGARTSDAGSNAHVGNIVDAFPASAIFANILIFNRVLTIGEIQAIQFRPHVESGCQIYSEYYGASTEPDWSGQVNNGTPTGTTVATHVPLQSPFAVDTDWMGAFTSVAAATTDNQPKLMLMGCGF